MRLRIKYILFTCIIHAVALGLSYVIFRKNKVIFIVAEAVIIVSLAIAWQLYRELIAPLQILVRGANAIREQDFNVKFLLTGRYEMDELIRTYNEMMEHVQVERTRQEQQHFFLEKLIQTSPTGIIVLDPDENVFSVNPKAAEMLKLDGASAGKSIHAFNHPLAGELGQLVTGDRKTVTVNGMETYMIQKSAFMDRGFARSFIMIEEVTAEIHAAERNAYGKVIRMMAHEVNNTIGPVNSIMDSALMATGLSEVLRNALQVAIQRNNNLNSFMRNLAELVRLPMPDRKPVDIIGLLKSVTALMEVRAAETGVEFYHAFHETSAFIHADALQMEQVIINILKNSLEAMEAGGSITVFTYGNPTRMIIQDTGKGISPGSEQKLFSPFFSTKKDGQGLGLTMIREILYHHGFNFSLKTVRSGITEFAIFFE